MADRSVGDQVKAGFRSAGVWLLGMAWLALVFGGMAIVFTPSRHAPWIGWSLLVIAAFAFFITMNRWIVAFSALLAYGLIGGLITIVSGHVVNRPDVPVPRLYSIIMTFLFAGSALVSYTFMQRRLRLLDRIALFAFVVCFFWRSWEGGVDWHRLLALVLGFAFLVGAWAYDRFHLRERLPEV